MGWHKAIQGGKKCTCAQSTNVAESLSYPRSYPTCLRVKKAQNPGSYATVQTKARSGILELRGDATFEMSAKNTETGGTGHDHRGPGAPWVGEPAAGCLHSPPFPILPLLCPHHYSEDTEG